MNAYGMDNLIQTHLGGLGLPIEQQFAPVSSSNFVEDILGMALTAISRDGAVLYFRSEDDPETAVPVAVQDLDGSVAIVRDGAILLFAAEEVEAGALESIEPAAMSVPPICEEPEYYDPDSALMSLPPDEVEEPNMCMPPEEGVGYCHADGYCVDEEGNVTYPGDDQDYQDAMAEGLGNNAQRFADEAPAPTPPDGDEVPAVDAEQTAAPAPMPEPAASEQVEEVEHECSSDGDLDLDESGVFFPDGDVDGPPADEGSPNDPTELDVSNELGMGQDSGSGGGYDVGEMPDTSSTIAFDPIDIGACFIAEMSTQERDSIVAESETRRVEKTVEAICSGAECVVASSGLPLGTIEPVMVISSRSNADLSPKGDKGVPRVSVATDAGLRKLSLIDQIQRSHEERTRAADRMTRGGHLNGGLPKLNVLAMGVMVFDENTDQYEIAKESEKKGMSVPSTAFIVSLLKGGEVSRKEGEDRPVAELSTKRDSTDDQQKKDEDGDAFAQADEEEGEAEEELEAPVVSETPFAQGDAIFTA